MKENELLIELEKLSDLFSRYKKSKNQTLTVQEVEQLKVILSVVKVTYPTVKFPLNLNGSCGSCFKSFIESIIPIWDRISKVEVIDNEDKTLINSGELLDYVLDGGDDKGTIETLDVDGEPYQAINTENPFNPVGYEEVKEVEKPKRKYIKKKK